MLVVRSVLRPLLFSLGFLLAFVGLFASALHNLAPHDVRVAVVGPPSVVDATRTALGSSAGAFDMHRRRIDRRANHQHRRASAGNPLNHAGRGIEVQGWGPGDARRAGPKSSATRMPVGTPLRP